MALFVSGIRRSDSSRKATCSTTSTTLTCLDHNIAEVADLGRRYHKPVGNTEGWGTINWLDHPALSWDIIKQSGEICAGLGAKHGYRFNCTSNFTHPQFPRLWNDIAWHKRLTATIRSASVH